MLPGGLILKKWFDATVLVAPIAVLCAVLTSGDRSTAQTPPVPAVAPAPFNPGFADLMNLIVQPRHTKLWLAGKEANWVLAEYELKELRGALANVAKARPRIRDQSAAELLETFMSAPFRTADEAIRERSAVKFAEAYGRLNEGCNGCHRSLEHKFVVIRTPEQVSYPDQEFRPAP
jgi:hypothetical protein